MYKKFMVFCFQVNNNLNSQSYIYKTKKLKLNGLNFKNNIFMTK